MEIHITRRHDPSERWHGYPKEALMCPICGREAFVSHDIVDGSDYGWSVGCPAFKSEDGIHGWTFGESPEEEKFTAHMFCTKEEAIHAWNERVKCGKWQCKLW